MANERGKEMDNTHLSLDIAVERGFIHRDYIAHCLRWSHVSKFLRAKHRYQTYHVLDVGCGKEMPLPRMLFADRMTHTSGSYTGVDINKLEIPVAIADRPKFNVTALGKTNFIKAELPRPHYDLIVSFEVMEHVEPRVTWEILSRMRSLADKDTAIFISTPCYDAHVGAAANHVNEMTVEGLSALIHMARLYPVNRWGTFASQTDYKHLLAARGLQDLFAELSDYYDSNVLACVLAPLFPDNARNCLWQLEVSAEKMRIPGPDILDQKHSSSKRWADDLKKIMKEVR